MCLGPCNLWPSLNPRAPYNVATSVNLPRTIWGLCAEKLQLTAHHNFGSAVRHEKCLYGPSYLHFRFGCLCALQVRTLSTVFCSCSFVVCFFFSPKWLNFHFVLFFPFYTSRSALLQDSPLPSQKPRGHALLFVLGLVNIPPTLDLGMSHGCCSGARSNVSGVAVVLCGECLRFRSSALCTLARWTVLEYRVGGAGLGSLLRHCSKRQLGFVGARRNRQFFWVGLQKHVHQCTL